MTRQEEEMSTIDMNNGQSKRIVSSKPRHIVTRKNMEHWQTEYDQQMNAPTPYETNALHRRGTSLDETRVQIGLFGVANSNRVPPVFPNSSHHRRTHSHTDTYTPTSNSNRYIPNPFPPAPYASYLSPPALLHRSISSQPFLGQSIGLKQQQQTNLPEVKFVNSTVEILEDQIRKEEAPKKKRTRTTPEQLRILQKAFNADPMPNSDTRIALAKKLGMNARAVQVWFQNRRAKAKLEAKRAEGRSTGESDSPTELMDEEDEEEYEESVADHAHQPTTFRATNRSLKATGLMGRMAFPPDIMDGLNGFNDHHIQHSHQLSALQRSQSLPFLAGNLDAFLTNNPMYAPANHASHADPYEGPEVTDEMMMLADDGMVSGGVMGRPETAPFAPYEFSAGSTFHKPPATTLGTPTAPPSSLSHSKPMREDDTFMDLLPPMDDAVWPEPPEMFTSPFEPLSTSQGHLRRSFSLPNVFQPPPPPIDYFLPSPLAADEDDMQVEETAMKASVHRHQPFISHHPDYPENINDFLTSGEGHFDEC